VDAPQLIGSDTMQTWGTAGAMYQYFSVAMPPNAPGQLGEETYLDIMAHILQMNGAEANTTALAVDALGSINLAQLSGGGAAAPAPTPVAATPEVPQAFTFRQQLPTVEGAAPQAAPAAASGVPQAFTFGQELPTVEAAPAGN
jgi:hypothetical protein